ncbi:YgaP family membrane protein [Niabella drilacis]|uniref:Inner membrane protein YgaP-like transmembrane domain-containing protein n=1 Tax=Niabella drilacis (strain DSM 25811 / CCM 8410 / CCUG 62505 / LMG 26954 / E90) TaxID=1285928 RepID=A0A1G6RHE6_NIADE|nr:DUF2892 domain-containing protein [Niabella drilacis]SDD03346.1 Protein of unknown function [Niabella drilacis]
MKKNIGTTDKALRLLVAVAILGACLANRIQGITAVILGILAGILLLTSVAGICPLYRLFGINTIKKRRT